MWWNLRNQSIRQIEQEATDAIKRCEFDPHSDEIQMLLALTVPILPQVGPVCLSVRLSLSLSSDESASMLNNRLRFLSHADPEKVTHDFIFSCLDYLQKS